MTDQALLDKTAEMIFVLCKGYGFDILRYPENLCTYLQKKLPGANQAVDLYVRVIRLPHAVDCLMWCIYFAEDPQMLSECEEAFVEIIRSSEKEDAKEMERAFRRLVRQAAGS